MKELHPSRLALAEAEKLVHASGGVPLNYRTWHWEDDGSGQGTGREVPVDQPVENLVEDLRRRVAWLEDDVILAERRIVDPDCPEDIPFAELAEVAI
jgi:hypothetical protein